MCSPEVIALYLPQFHPTPNNNKWWGEGFTEWTNVGKAKPLFPGHDQPKVPSELGYYDLRLAETRQKQSDLAKEAGISAFCYYHYWFGNGIEELELPFEEVVKCGNPDFPFCLCWANESWHKKFWTDFNVSQKIMLREQLYPGKQDIEDHFYRLLPAFKDSRYFKVSGRNLFMIYKPFEYPEIELFIKEWNRLANQESIPAFYFVAQIQECPDQNKIDKLINMGFDAVNIVGLYEASRELYQSYSPLKRFLKRITRFISHKVLSYPEVYEYKNVFKFFNNQLVAREDCIPTLIPNWDHTPRSGKNGLVYKNSTPSLFKKHVDETMAYIEKKSNKLVFLKSWNEWGEGNYMEPDLRWGRGYIEALKEILRRYV